jgi:hypothetical protein
LCGGQAAKIAEEAEAEELSHWRVGFERRIGVNIIIGPALNPHGQRVV